MYYEYVIGRLGRAWINDDVLPIICELEVKEGISFGSSSVAVLKAVKKLIASSGVKNRIVIIFSFDYYFRKYLYV